MVQTDLQTLLQHMQQTNILLAQLLVKNQPPINTIRTQQRLTLNQKLNTDFKKAFYKKYSL